MDALSIVFDEGTISFDNNSLSAASGQANDSAVRLNIKTVSIEDLNEEQKTSLEGFTVFSGLRISLTAGDTNIEDLGGGRVSISVPFTVPSGYTGRDFSVFHSGENGGLSCHATSYKDNYLTFRVAHFSDFIVLNDPAVQFNDVTDSDWFVSSVDYVTRCGFMVGLGENMFAPEATLTRAMLTQILYNMEPNVEVPDTGIFDDVSPEAWFADAVNWAAHVGIVNGIDEGLFAPNNVITREQLAQMLYNYANYT